MDLPATIGENGVVSSPTEATTVLGLRYERDRICATGINSWSRLVEHQSNLLIYEKGETVVDLGSGGGIDVFLSANKVSKTGKVIGIDMTDEMLERARSNAKVGQLH